jgi:MscS family membrane protein
MMNRRGAMKTLAVVLLAGVVGGERSAEAQHPIVDVSGEWNSVFAGGTSTLRLTQYGATVVGVYGSSASMPGAMAGRINGRLMLGRWTDASSSGGFRLEFSRDGRNFTGTWGRTVDSNTTGGPWVGHR